MQVESFSKTGRHALLQLFLHHDAWNTDVIAGALAALQDHEEDMLWE